MAFIPPWALLIPFTILVLFFLIPLLFHVLLPRYLFSFRLASRRPKEIFALGLPAALIIAVVFSSLSVGDSLYLMVEQNVEKNLSGVDLALSVPGYMSEEVWTDSGAAGEVEGWAPVILLEAGRAENGGSAGGSITLIGADKRINDIVPIYQGGRIIEPPDRGGVLVNKEMAGAMDLGPGDQLTLRVPLGTSSMETLLGHSERGWAEMTLRVEGVIDDRGLGRFRMDGSSGVDPTAVVPLSYLGERLDRQGMVNYVLIDLDGAGDDEVDMIRSLIGPEIGYPQLGYEIKRAESAGGYLLTSDDLLFSPPEDLGGVETLSYFVDGISSGSSSISYSVVTWVDADVLPAGALRPPLPDEDLRKKTVINNWTAEKLGVSRGDTLSITYRRVGPTGELRYDEVDLEVLDVIGIEGLAAERGLLPEVEGLTDADSCTDWDPSFEVDLGDIGDHDIEYWNRYRTTPKAFLFDNGIRANWSTTGGDTTAVWFNGGNASPSDIGSSINTSVGLSDLPGQVLGVRVDAMESSRGLSIFPMMFFTFGSVIVLAAVLVLAAVTVDINTRRRNEHSLLKALGAGRLRFGLLSLDRSLLGAAAGGLMGVPLGVICALGLNLGLGTFWSGSIENVDAPFTVEPLTMAFSAACGMLLSTVMTFSVMTYQIRPDPAAHMNKQDPTVGRGISSVRFLTGGVLIAASGAAALLIGSGMYPGATSSLLFVLGSLLTAGGISLLLLTSLKLIPGSTDLLLMVRSGLLRRPGRVPVSVLLISITLALSLSMTSVGGLLESESEQLRKSYGGRFDHVVELSVPFRGDPDELADSDRDVKMLLPLPTVGEEGGTCSNINAPYPPRLVGIPFFEEDPGYGFRIEDRHEGYGSDGELWGALDERPDGKVPVLVDRNTLLWIYGKGLGDTFTLQTEVGKEALLLVVGILSPSVLTGTFVMGKETLLSIYPESAVYDLVLVESSFGSDEEAREDIASLLSDFGPYVKKVDDLASGNLEYELSYLMLFRDFTSIGLVTALLAAAVFLHVRTLSVRSELEVWRSLGVGKKRALSYVMTENCVIFLLAGLGALLGSALSLLVFWGDTSASVPDAVGGTLVLLALYVAASLSVSAASSLWSLRDYSGMVRRGE